MNALQIIIFGSLLLFSPTQAVGWDDLVVSVEAGDRVTVMHNGKQEPLQLYGLQCPHVKSIAGKQAMEYTAAKVLDRRVKVRPMRKGHLALVEAVVFVGGHNLGASLIKAGWARVDQQRCSESFCSQWLRFEQHARQRKKGGWRKPTRK